LVSADYFGSTATDTPYLPQGFEAEGFIHCMYGPINRDAIV